MFKSAFASTLATALMLGALFTPSPAKAVEEGTIIHVCVIGSGGWGFAMMWEDGQWVRISGAVHYKSCASSDV